MMKTRFLRWLSPTLLPSLTLLGVAGIFAHFAPAADDAILPGTKPLDPTGKVTDTMLADQMMSLLHEYIGRKIDKAPHEREVHWKRDLTSPAAYEKSIEPNRKRFHKIVGLVDPRLPARMERFGDDRNPSLVAQTERYRVWQVRWPVLEGVWGEGLLLEPKAKPTALVVAMPDADQTPEQLVGLAPGVDAKSQFARRLVQAGALVVVPTLVDRSDRWSGHPDVGWTNQPHREWIYRQAFMMGRHIIGYEVQKVMAAVDWFKQSEHKGLKVGVAGYGEGGLIAFYAAAADPRIDGCLVNGYFDCRQDTWMEPLYRNVWGLLVEFGDAEIATLIAPRGLVVEHCPFPQVAGPPAARAGRRNVAAVGRIAVSADRGRRYGTRSPIPPAGEFGRIHELIGPAGPSLQVRHLVRAEAPGSPQAMEHFGRLLGIQVTQLTNEESLADARTSFDPGERQQRQVKQLEAHVQALVRGADRVREQFFVTKAAPWYADRRRQWTTEKHVDTFPVEPFVEKAKVMKQYLWEEVLGKLHDQPQPFSAYSRKIYDRPKWVGYDVQLNVFGCMRTWGILLLPKDLKPGERRPVVVCQHGRNGLPAQTIERGEKAYYGVSAALADRGFIVFAPHNPYRGEDRYRILSRKANTVKASLFSFILAQHEQILKWLATLPAVDASRIGFYGCSYGGETAVRVPPLLDGYALSICSSDFNDWARKVASTDSPFSFMFSVEWEMPYFDLGSTFNYAEMAYLMIPRPFMVERGHCDTVAPDEWVAYEYAKVRWMYDMLGLGDRTEIEFFTGGHCFRCQRAFDFLEKHLQWKGR